MKHSFYVLAILLLATITAWARPVRLEQAQQVAVNFYASQNQGNDLVRLSQVETGFRELYVFNYNDGSDGFVIIPADDVAMPVLAYSFSNPFRVPMRENVEGWLSDYALEIRWAVENRWNPSPECIIRWHKLMDGPSDPNIPLNTGVSPLLTTTWDQSPYYNNMCPTNSDGRAVVGCVATAMAQVMKYWNSPTSGTGSHSYYCSGFGTLSANFGNTTYDWSNMPNALSASSSSTQINAVATLMYHCGVAVEMEYGVNGSGAYTPEYYTGCPSAEHALKTYFGYSTSLSSYFRDNYNLSTWTSALATELNAGRPVIYSGSDTSGGHCFVCDGYQLNGSSYQFHFNWGWSGYCDGYYAIDALNPSAGGTGGNSTYTFNLNQTMIIGIQPVGASGCTISSFPWTEGFEGDIPCWHVLGGDTYGDNWIRASGVHHTGSYCLASASYNTSAGVGVTPDNWVTTPALALPANNPCNLTWYSAPLHTSYPAEHYTVYLGYADSSTSCFTTQLYSETISDTNWTLHTINLSAYAGQTVYIAFRHHNCYDQYYLLLDDVSVTPINQGTDYTISLVCSGNGTGYMASLENTTYQRACGDSFTHSSGSSATYYAVSCNPNGQYADYGGVLTQLKVDGTAVNLSTDPNVSIEADTYDQGGYRVYSYTFNNIQANHTLEGVFGTGATNGKTITLQCSGDGIGYMANLINDNYTRACGSSFSHSVGSSATYYAVSCNPNGSYATYGGVLTQLKVDGVAVNLSSDSHVSVVTDTYDQGGYRIYSYTFTNIQADHVLEGVFSAAATTNYTISLQCSGDGRGYLANLVGDNYEHACGSSFTHSEGSIATYYIISCNPNGQYASYGGVLTQLKVDGTAVNLSSDSHITLISDTYNQGGFTVYAYTFSNIHANHTLEGVYSTGVGIDEVETQSINIYPNPTSGIVNIQVDNPVKIDVIDQLGRTVATFAETSQINLSDLLDGVYTLRIATPQDVFIQRIILKK